MPNDASDGLVRLAVFCGLLKTHLKTGCDETVTAMAPRILGRLRVAASGPPGPNRRTGRYVAGLMMQIESNGEGFTATIGSNHPAGPRLENGFTGTDRRGAHISQRPRPHYAPTYDWTVAQLGPEVERRIQIAVGQAAAAAGIGR